MRYDFTKIDKEIKQFLTVPEQVCGMGNSCIVCGQPNNKSPQVKWLLDFIHSAITQACKSYAQNVIEQGRPKSKSVLPNVLEGRNDEIFDRHGIDGIKCYNTALADYKKRMLDIIK